MGANSTVDSIDRHPDRRSAGEREPVAAVTYDGDVGDASAAAMRRLGRWRPAWL
jgi:hypothetical protein